MFTFLQIFRELSENNEFCEIYQVFKKENPRISIIP